MAIVEPLSSERLGGGHHAFCVSRRRAVAIPPLHGRAHPR
jgi:hypothetical protein